MSVFYDEDNDGELDTGLFRIPKEPVGSSNNARSKFGPPEWKDTHFDLENDMHVTIQVADATRFSGRNETPRLCVRQTGYRHGVFDGSIHSRVRIPQQLLPARVLFQQQRRADTPLDSSRRQL